ncbi:MAG: signal peptidase I [Pirellulaceae bacterium]|nr:signal peptidase I [Pirellulaceae bacterium]
MHNEPDNKLAAGRSRGGLARRTVAAVVLLVIAVLAVGQWLVGGLGVPMTVCSGSMAPAVLGPHCRFKCAACDREFACGADLPETGRWRVCPHCGDVVEITSPPKVREGDRVLLLRAAFGRKWPRRWELAAFRDPQRPSRAAIKRVVGLPGETVRIRQGDVYVNGRIAAKNWATQRKMAVLVHDASTDGTNPNEHESRWKPADAASGWTRRDMRFSCGGDSADASSVDWLVYHHLRREGNSLIPGPVTDELSYNQWRTLRADQIEAVRDLTLCFRATRLAGEGWLVVRANDDEDRLETWIRPESGSCEFRYKGQTVASGTVATSDPVTEGEVTVSLVDGQWILAWNGLVVLRHERPEAVDASRPSERPWAIGSAGLTMEIDPPRVYRDTHYGRPPGVLARWGFDEPVVLGPDEFFVLGDNSPVSDDSRSWPDGPGVPAKLLLGRAVIVRIP